MPSNEINIILPEFHINELIGLRIAARAGLKPVYHEPIAFKFNGVFEGFRVVEGQSGPGYMRAKGLPIGFTFDPMSYLIRFNYKESLFKFKEFFRCNWKER